jgi:hypothetical protein
MGDCNDVHDFERDAVDQVIRKAGEDKLPKFCIYRRSNLGIFKQNRTRGSHFGIESLAEG